MNRSNKNSVKESGDQGFQESILSMLEWLADRDPIKAASLINAYLDELSNELGGAQRAR